jgi:hypothetical protein
MRTGAKRARAVPGATIAVAAAQCSKGIAGWSTRPAHYCRCPSASCSEGELSSRVIGGGTPAEPRAFMSRTCRCPCSASTTSLSGALPAAAPSRTNPALKTQHTGSAPDACATNQTSYPARDQPLRCPSPARRQSGQHLEHLLQVTVFQGGGLFCEPGSCLRSACSEGGVGCTAEAARVACQCLTTLLPQPPVRAGWSARSRREPRRAGLAPREGQGLRPGRAQRASPGRCGTRSAARRRPTRCGSRG